jgi:hypothetical protein
MAMLPAIIIKHTVKAPPPLSELSLLLSRFAIFEYF